MRRAAGPLARNRSERLMMSIFQPRVDEARRLRLFYGWIVVAVAFVTMAVTISARSSFSLLFPEILGEFGWERGPTAAAFSLGFLASTALLPLIAWGMRRRGPQLVIPVGAAMIAIGYALTPLVTTPLAFYVTMGFLVVAGSMAASYISHSMFLPAWFVRRRGLAVGLAFAGVGVGMATLMPLMQWAIDAYDWRTACFGAAAFVALTVIPLNFLLQRGDPDALGLEPDGGPARGVDGAPVAPVDVVVDRAWAETDWTLGRAARTARYWWLSLMMFGALFVWYATLAHQTQFLIELDYSPAFGAFALGLAPLFGVAGQVAVGALSDRIGREWAWSVATLGFFVSSALFVVMTRAPEGWPWMTTAVFAAIIAQGLLGHGLAAVFGAAIAEIFQGRQFFGILAMITLAGNVGAALGVWALGEIYDATTSYEIGFALCAVASLVSIAAIWGARPSAVRLVAGRARRR